MNRVETSSGALYQSRSLASLPWLCHGFGTRGVALDRYIAHFQNEGAVFALTNQKHGGVVHVLNEDVPQSVLEGDAFITRSKNVICFVRSADCVPILVCDRKRRAIGAIHAGWRGIACDVIGAAVSEMKRIFSSRSEDILAAVGPGICSRCFSVGRDVLDIFDQNGLPEWLRRVGNRGDEYFIDLKLASQFRLIESGIRPDQISVLPLCTSCAEDDFASYRRDRKEKSRQVNFIFLR